ncbi:DUF11 domain-containing protein [candidate division KSB1 bacterium]|nr:DUF11 domain-containing protein [candidate division KSB1 bacterium]
MKRPAKKSFQMSKVLSLGVTFLLLVVSVPNASTQQELCEEPLMVTTGPDTIDVGDIAVLANEARWEADVVCINITNRGTYLIETEIMYSGARQMNESFYLEVCDSAKTSCIDPCDPNSSFKKIVQKIVEDTNNEEIILIRKAGHFFLNPGNYLITLNHYKKWVEISGDSSFINGDKIGSVESVHLHKLILTQISERFDCPRNYDLDITKTVRPPSVFAGQAFTYALNIFNNGPGNANNFTITDVLPDLVFPLDFLTNPPTEQTGQILNWKDVTLDSGGTYSIEFTATFPDSFEVKGDSLERQNSSFVNAALDTNAQNDTAFAVVYIKPLVYDLELKKSVSKSSAIPGDTFTYSFRIRNKGPGKASNIQLTDVLPDSIAPVDFLNDDIPIDPTSRTLKWQLAPLGSGQTKEINFTAVFPETFEVKKDSLEKINFSFVEAKFDFNSENDTSSAIIFIKPVVYDLELTKNANPSTVVPGETFTYSLQIRNNGPDTANNIRLTDLLPDSIQPVNFITDIPLDPTSRRLEWNLLPLDSGAIKNIEFTATFMGSLGSTERVREFVNTAFVGAPFDTNTQNDTAAVLVSVLPPLNYDLVLTKSVSRDTVVQGQTFSYTLEITNNGPETVPRFSVWDAFPDGVSISDFSLQPINPFAQDTLRWRIETPLLSGEKISITYAGICPVLANFTNPQTKINAARVIGENDSDPTNDSATASTVCLPPTDSCNEFVNLDRSLFEPDGQTQLAITVELDVITDVTLDIFDITGYPIKRISTANATIGLNTFFWDGQTNEGLKAGSGVYIVVVRDKAISGRALECIKKVLVVR